jgi:hypothetical protein
MTNGDRCRYVRDRDLAFANPLVPDRLWVEDHQKSGQFKWCASKVSLYLSKAQEKCKWIEGHYLREHLKGQPVLNANVLDYLLANPHIIPVEWKGKDVFFWGTIYRVSNGSLWIRYLCWRIEYRWHWNVRLPADTFGDNDPAAVSAS